NEYVNLSYEKHGNQAVLLMNGVEIGSRATCATLLNQTLDDHSVGSYIGTTQERFKGRLYGMQFGDHLFDLSEGSGNTITSNLGAEYTINDGTWGVEEVISIVESADTFFQCDTILLRDWYVDDIDFENDLLTLHRSDG